jgi:hypothetical protein
MKSNIRTLAICGGILALCTAAQAQTIVIGNWEGGSTDGWQDWNGGSPVSISTLPSKYSFSTTTGVTLGSESLEVTQAGYQQNLAISLSGSQRTAFMNDNTLSFDITYPAQTFTSGFSQIYQLALNAPGYGFNNFPGTANPVAGAGVGYGGVTGDQTIHVSLNYSSALGSITPSPGYIQLIFALNSDANHPNFFFDNVTLSSVPEPTTLALAGLGGLASLMALRRKK